ncbi:NAD(P)-dependent oxidoreductase [Asanoa sp. WMMD1127]|uniref:NAD(P)-dependent oxidoreductase n=1 Tax=Asanoa sp. WMMD1127 TaxID=3016107 RepID=UPI0024167BEC|nr:NAD(P)-dependent oxidoreductase [Asanoa sp. WMMD1127]MDG4820774.1 NAD(P)-dependent oxidoreductase [Asanoa sp. WMMD1127]
MNAPTPRVAVVGLGGMGGGVAKRLVAAGLAPLVWNRSEGKARALVTAGAVAAGSPAEVAAAADVVLVSLSDEQAVEEVLFGEMLPHLRAGSTVVEMTTLAPGYARAAAERLAKEDVRRVEACLIGNPEMAEAGHLRVFVAGERAHVDAVQPVFDALARQGMLYLGPTGQAAAMKLAFNLLLGVQTAGLAEAVLFAEQAGLSRELLLTAIQKSGWRSPVLNFRADFMRTRTYQPPGFRAELMAKDMRLAVGDAQAQGVSLPMTRQAALRFDAAVSAGSGDSDAAVVVEIPTGDPDGPGRDELNGA